MKSTAEIYHIFPAQNLRHWQRGKKVIQEKDAWLREDGTLTMNEPRKVKAWVCNDGKPFISQHLAQRHENETKFREWYSGNPEHKFEIASDCRIEVDDKLVVKDIEMMNWLSDNREAVLRFLHSRLTDIDDPDIPTTGKPILGDDGQPLQTLSALANKTIGKRK